MARVFQEVEPRREKGAQRTFRINVLIQDGIEEARGSEPSFELSQLNQTMLSRAAASVRFDTYYFENTRKRNLTPARKRDGESE